MENQENSSAVPPVPPNPILEAVEKLDKSNVNHWTDGGLPKLETIRLLTGNPKVSRDDIQAAAPGYTRTGPAQVLVADASSQEQTDEEEYEAPFEDPASVRRAKIAELLQGRSLEELDAAITQGNQMMANINSDIAELTNDRDQLSKELDTLIDLREKCQPCDSVADTLVAHTQSRQKVYEERAQRVKALREADIDLTALAVTKAPIDAAITARNIKERRDNPQVN